jgi:thymidylate kinase
MSGSRASRAAEFPQRFRVIDASGTIAGIQATLVRILDEFFDESIGEYIDESMPQ